VRIHCPETGVSRCSRTTGQCFVQRSVSCVSALRQFLSCLIGPLRFSQHLRCCTARGQCLGVEGPLGTKAHVRSAPGRYQTFQVSRHLPEGHMLHEAQGRQFYYRVWSIPASGLQRMITRCCSETVPAPRCRRSLRRFWNHASSGPLNSDSRRFAEITSISLSSLWCVARENRAHHGSECGTNVQ
jgi:hypothetical protein